MISLELEDGEIVPNININWLLLPPPKAAHLQAPQKLRHDHFQLDPTFIACKLNLKQQRQQGKRKLLPSNLLLSFALVPALLFSLILLA